MNRSSVESSKTLGGPQSTLEDDTAGGGGGDGGGGGGSSTSPSSGIPATSAAVGTRFSSRQQQQHHEAQYNLLFWRINCRADHLAIFSAHFSEAAKASFRRAAARRHPRRCLGPVRVPLQRLPPHPHRGGAGGAQGGVRERREVHTAAEAAAPPEAATAAAATTTTAAARQLRRQQLRAVLGGLRTHVGKRLKERKKYHEQFKEQFCNFVFILQRSSATRRVAVLPSSLTISSISSIREGATPTLVALPCP